MNKICIGITTWNNIDNFDNIKKMYNNDQGFKVYIADDLSNDGLIEKYQENGIEFMSVPYKVGAPGLSRNMILEAAIVDGYEFITFCDGDDYFDLNNLAKVQENLTPDIDIAYVHMISEFEDIQHITKNANTGLNGKYNVRDIEKYTKLSNIFMASGGRIYNLKTVEDNNLKYALDLPGQDTLFNTHMRQVCKFVYIDNQNCFYYRTFDRDSLSNKVSIKSLFKRYDAINQITKMKTFNESQRVLKNRFKELNNIRELEDDKKVEGLNILFKDLLDDPEYLDLYESCIANILYQPALRERRINKNFVPNHKEHGLTIISTDPNVSAQIENLKDLETLNVQLVKPEHGNVKGLNIAIKEIMYSKVMFVNKNFIADDFNIKKLVSDLKLLKDDEIAIPILKNNSNIRNGSYENCFLYENIFKESGNVFYGSIFDSNKVQALRFFNLGKDIVVSHEFLIMYIQKYGVRPLIYPDYGLKLCNSKNKLSNAKSNVAQTLINKNELILAQSLTDLSKIAVNTPHVFVYKKSYNYEVIAGTPLTETQLHYLNYQISNICTELVDGVYFTNEFNEIAGVVKFRNQEFNSHNYVRVDVGYQNDSSTTLTDLLTVDNQLFEHAIEGQFSIDEVLNIQVENTQLQSIVRHTKVDKPLSEGGLTLLSLDEELKHSMTDDRIQVITISTANLFAELTAVFDQIKYARTMFVNKNTSLENLDLDSYLQFLDTNKNEVIINTIKYSNGIVPNNNFNKENAFVRSTISLLNLCVKTELLNITYEGTENKNAQYLLLQSLIRRFKIDYNKYCGIDNEKIRHRFMSYDEQILYLTNEDKKRIDLYQGLQKGQLVCTPADLKYNQTNEWLVPFECSWQVNKYISKKINDYQSHGFDGVVIKSGSRINNVYLFNQVDCFDLTKMGVLSNVQLNNIHIDIELIGSETKKV